MTCLRSLYQESSVNFLAQSIDVLFPLVHRSAEDLKFILYFKRCFVCVCVCARARARAQASVHLSEFMYIMYADARS